MEKFRRENLVFIGFMGAGKTTIGKLVAQKLNRKFIDTDEVIEEEFNMPPSQIFKEYGEQVFRDKEKSIITNLCEQKNKVLSLGGGAFLQEEIRKVCLQTSIVIFLAISFEKWKDRIDLIFDSRPVLHGKTIDEMEALFNGRQEIYANHHVKIQTDNKTTEEIVNEIVEKIADL